MVLPAHGAAGVAREPSQWQTAQLGEATLDSRVAPRFIYQPERLVKEGVSGSSPLLGFLFERRADHPAVAPLVS